MFGLMVACGSGDVAGDPEGVLGMREGGRGTTFEAGGLEELCAKALDCSPASAPVATIDACVELLEPLLDDLLADAPPACASAFQDVLACMGATAECVEGELVPPGDSCLAEAARVEAACDGWEPDLELDLESYVESEVPIDG